MTDKSQRITFYLSNKQWTDLKIMCVLTKRTMSKFIRLSIQDKINEIRKQNEMSKLPPISN